MKIVVVFNLADGGAVDVELAAPDEVVLSGYEIHIDDGPVVAAPFSIHSDTGRYHTVCRRRRPGVYKIDTF